MTYDQHNFLVVVSAKAESITARMNEAFEVKMALVRYFLNSDYKFAIVGEDIISNEMRLGTVLNLVISIIPHDNDTVNQIAECAKLKAMMANIVGDLGYRCMVADEEMMSDFAKKKIQYLPKEGGEWYEQ